VSNGPGLQTERVPRTVGGDSFGTAWGASPRMHVVSALVSLHFWIYTGVVAALLAAAWPVLFLWKRGDPQWDELRRVWWTWVWFAAACHPAILLGREAFALVVGLVSLFACKEFARITGLYEDWLFTGLVYLSILAVNLMALLGGYDVFMASPIYAVAVLCALPVLRNRSDGMLQCVALAVISFVYFGFFLAHLSLLAAIPTPTKSYPYLLYLLYGTATADLVGWVVDHWLGRHRLLARIGSSITLEGALAGLAWAFVWSFLLGQGLPAEFTWLALALAAMVFGILGPLGELVMQYILHDLGLKTSGEGPGYVPSLALGHLHRLIFVAPIFFRLLHWFDPLVLQGP
jgi:predicted CDP-diglyceride synthetase/phosphatidate cytidylyltransferase